MSLISISFIIFLLLILSVYYLVPRKCQVYVLALANIVFYAFSGVRYLPIIIVVCLFSFGVGVLIESIRTKGEAIRISITDKQERKLLTHREEKIVLLLEVLAVVILLSIWIVVKFVFSTIPLGISFYIFIAISYVVDVCWQKYSPEHNFVKYSAFLCFFPHLTQGPFSRYNVLGKTLYEEHEVCWKNIKEGLLLILWGLIKKTVIGYRLGLICDRIMMNEDIYGGIFILILAICLTLQLYSDFSGYMDIVSGISLLFGIRLQQNFRQPIFSKSVEEIWHRWHITLGEWFKEYVFYPISTSKAVQKISKACKEHFSTSFSRTIPVYIALVFVWTATGLWHGLAVKYLAWGWINLAFIVAGIAFKKYYQILWKFLHVSENNKLLNVFRMVRTFLIFSFMELVSSAPSFRSAIRWLKSLIIDKTTMVANDTIPWTPGIEWLDFIIIIIGLLVLLAVDILHERGVSIIESMDQWKMIPRFCLYCVCIYTVLLFGEIGGNVTFMYAQF